MARLPFFVSTMFSVAPLKLIYSDVWGLALLQSVDEFNYYLFLLIILQNIFGYVF